MKQYQVNTMDVCCQGFERLRTNSEFLIVAPITAEVTFEVLKSELIADISSCEQPDGFDYPAAMRDIGTWLDDYVKPEFERKANPFDIESPPSRAEAADENQDWDYPNFYLYVQELEPEMVE